MAEPAVVAPSQAEGGESPAPVVEESPQAPAEPSGNDLIHQIEPVVEPVAGAPEPGEGGAKPEGEGEAKADEPSAPPAEPEVTPAPEPVAETPPADVAPTDREKKIQSTSDTLVSDANKLRVEAETAKEAAELRAQDAQGIIDAKNELIRRKMSDSSNPLDLETATRQATLEVSNAYQTIELERQLEAANAKVTAAEQGQTTTELQALALSITDKAEIDDPKDRGRVLAMGGREAMQEMADIIVDAKAHRTSKKETAESEVPAGGPANDFDGGGGAGSGGGPMTDAQKVKAFGDANNPYNDSKEADAAGKRMGLWN